MKDSRQEDENGSWHLFLTILFLFGRESEKKKKKDFLFF